MCGLTHTDDTPAPSPCQCGRGPGPGPEPCSFCLTLYQTSEGLRPSLPCRRHRSGQGARKGVTKQVTGPARVPSSSGPFKSQPGDVFKERLPSNVLPRRNTSSGVYNQRPIMKRTLGFLGDQTGLWDWSSGTCPQCQPCLELWSDRRPGPFSPGL